jgi:hypothetical protein
VHLGVVYGSRTSFIDYTILGGRLVIKNFIGGRLVIPNFLGGRLVI